ncbi:putative elongator complex protein 1 [Elasticomyces elasticus]|nr:putative elongator complex protein 1 [Elasticomyces elasticus]
MRNLRCAQRSVFKGDPGGLPPTATAWDASSDSLICAFGPSEASAIIKLKSLVPECENIDEARLIASWDAPSPLPDLAVDQILNLHCLAGAATATICLILSGGDIIVVREDPQPGEDQIEIVGSVDAGITAAAWSPDEELLAICTRANNLLFMTQDFESVANIAFTPEDVKVSAHVDVGWGKKETQFQGKRARALRDPTVPEHVDEGKLSPLDRGEVTISWRGDGEYVAVNSIEANRRRMIRVYSRDGTLGSVSEPVDGLEGALSWRPSGNLMAGIQWLGDHADVVFFERNGLRHGQFSLRLTKDDLEGWASAISLVWNSDSTVLAVRYRDRVQLWTMGNYHYYLKQEIYCNGEAKSTDSAIACWHPEKPLHLVFTSNGKSNDVAINKTGSRLAALNQNSVAIYDISCITEEGQIPALLGSCLLPVCRARQLAFCGDFLLYVLVDGDKASVTNLCRVQLDALECCSLTPQPSALPITTLFARTDHEKILLQDSAGAVIEASLPINEDPTQLVCEVKGRFPESCARVEVWQNGDEVNCSSLTKAVVIFNILMTPAQSILFGLSNRGYLYARATSGADYGRELVRNCTSFLIAPGHLIFTTSQHLLKFVHLHHNGKLEVPLDEPEKDERCRSIERGAKLVTVMPTACAVILQMPRGNLETIYPRALVLAGIRRSIDVRDYKKAFFACRNQRVDMNILHDYAPEQLMSSVALFVKQVKKVEHIDLFLSQLRYSLGTLLMTVPVADTE